MQHNNKTMRQLFKLTKGTFCTLLAFLFIIYLSGGYGLYKAYKGTAQPDKYYLPLFWNFLFLTLTLIILF